MTYYINFPQMVVFSRETSSLLRKLLTHCISIPQKSRSFASMQRVLAKVRDSCGKKSDFLKKGAKKQNSLAIIWP